MRILFFNRAAEREMLIKATITKTVIVPAYTTKGGVHVPAHSKLVHFDPDKEVHHVVSGQGSHSQKKAHAKLHANVPGFKDLPVDEQFAHILSSATNIQKKASLSGVFSSWKSAASAGKNPTPGQWEAFYSQPKEKQQAALDEVGKATGGVFSHLSAPSVEVPPEKAAQIDAAVSKEAAASAAEAAVAQSKVKEILDGHGGHYPGKAAQKLTGDAKWQKAQPVEQLQMIVDLAKQMQAQASASAAVSGWKKAALAGKNPTAAQWAAFTNATDEAKKSALLNEVKDKVGGWGHLQHPSATKAVDAQAAKPEPKVIIPVGPKNGDTKVGADGVTLTFKDGRWHKPAAPDNFGAANPGVVFSTGGFLVKFDPVADQWDYKDHHGEWVEVLNEPLISAMNSGKTLDGEPLKKMEEAPAAASSPAQKPKPAKTPLAVKKLQAIDPAAVEKWLAEPAGKKSPEAMAFFDHVTKPARTKFLKWLQNHEKVFKDSPIKTAYKAAAMASLYGQHDKVLLPGGEFKPFLGLLEEEKAQAITDVAKVQAAAIALALGGSPAVAPAAAPSAAPSDMPSANADDAVFLTYNHTTDGHNKFWAVSWQGKSLVTKYGKIGSKGAVTVKEFASHAAAHAAMKKLMAEKEAKGYVFVQDGSPKDGDTKQGADGMLVFKDGHWHKVEQQAKKLTAAQIAAVGGHPNNKYTKAAIAAAKAGDANALQAAFDWANKADKPLPNTKAYIQNLATAMGAPLASGADATAPVAAAPAAPVVAAPKNKGAQVIDAWKQTGKQKGSNPGGVFTDSAGQQWYCKFPADHDVVKNEFLAAKFYQMLGVDVPNLKLVEKGGKLGIASKWVDGLSVGTAEQLSKAKGAHEAFAIDAWLGNWDVVGLANDNLMLGKNGAVRVDVGGSLLYRAQGGLKGDAFGETVSELDSLKDAEKNAKSAAVFAGAGPEAIAWGAGQLAKLSPGQISELCRKVGPGDRAGQDALAQKLIARRADLLQKLGVADPWNKPPMDETKLPVNARDLPKPIDFSNFNGPGKGLSSKAHVNELNSKDDAALIAFAAQGNLTALKNYHYDAVDKETGKPAGKKPITDHPSKHVKEHWAYLVELLDSIAHPSIQGLDMPPLGGGTAEEISQLAGFLKPGDRVATIPAEKRLGFWMKLANAGTDLHDLIPKQKLNFTQAMRKLSIGEWWPKVTSAVKGYVSAVQSTGWVNHVFSEGKTSVDVSGYSGGVQGLAAKVYADAIESPEGMEVYRWMKMPQAMMQQLLSESAGLVFQNTDSMCTSYNPGWAENSHFGSDCLMKIRYAKGAKAIHSFASGAFKSENEITTLPGARFVLLSAKKGNPATSSGIEIEVLMLPPHEGYVAELQSQAALGKSMIVFLVKGAENV